MANAKLDVAPRETLGKKVRQMRRRGVTPANVYGHRVDSRAVQAETLLLTGLLRQSSRNAIIDLAVEGEPRPRTVVVRDVQRDPVSDQILHVDFFQVSMTERMRTDVPVVLVGTAPAVGTHGGVLLQTLDSIAVEALPGDIPPQFDVNVSGLMELEQSVHVRDLAIDSEKVTLHTDVDVVLARVATPRLVAAEEGEAAAEEGAAEAPAEGAPAAEETSAPPTE